MVFKKGRIPWNKGKKGLQIAWNKNGNGTFTGRKHSEETKKKMSLSMRGIPHLTARGENNINWKGDAVGISPLHLWVRRHKPKPEACEKCGIISKRLDCSNNGIYNRDLNNWEYLCRSCHNKKDKPWLKRPPYSEETKRKMSASLKGKPAWNKGIPHTKETLKKMKENHKGMLGMKHTEESKLKMSLKRRGKDNPNYKGNK